MAIAGSLIVNLEARSQQLENELRKVRFLLRQTQAEVRRISEATSGVERSVVRDLQRVTAGFSGLQTGVHRAVTGFTQLFGVLAGFGGLQLVRQATAFADSIADMAQQVDISVEALQRFRFAAEQTGGSAQLMDRALNVLNQRIGEAATGSTEAQQRFANLGLRWQDLRRIGVEQSFLAIAEALSRIPDVTERAARQAEIFGERSSALANALSQGRAGLLALARQAENTGAVLDQQTTQRLADVNDELSKMANQIQVVLARVIVQITPQIKALSESFDRMAGAIADGEIGFRKLSNLESAVVTFFLNIGRAIEQFSPRLSSTLTDINNLIAILERVQGFVGSLPGLGNLFGTRAPSGLAEINSELALLTQQLQTLERQPINETLTIRIGQVTDRINALAAARQRLESIASQRNVGGGGVGAGARGRGRFRGTEALVESIVGPPQRDPFAVPGAGGRGGREAKTVLSALTEEARKAEGVFTTWREAIQSIEQEIRNLEPVTPLVKDLDEAAKKASVTFSSWEAAIVALEQEIRTLPPELAALDVEAKKGAGTFATWGEAIASIESEVRSVVTATRPLVTSLNEQFQTPLERLQAFQRALIEVQDLLRPGVAARALQDAQVEFARTTVLGQGLVVVADGIGEAFEQSFQGVIQGTQSVSAAFKQLAQSILLSISRILLQKGVTALLNLALTGLAPTTPVAGQEILLDQQGGLVPGPRGAGDSVPALLSPGEFVVRRAAVDAIGKQTLSRLNALGMQQGGLVPAFLSPGEFVVKRQAAEILGATTLAKINAMGYQQGGPVVPPVAHAANNRMDQGVTINNIVVRSDAEAQAKRQELEQLDGHIVNVINKQILGGDGSLINRSLSMVRGGR